MRCTHKKYLMQLISPSQKGYFVLYNENKIAFALKRGVLLGLKISDFGWKRGVFLAQNPRKVFFLKLGTSVVYVLVGSGVPGHQAIDMYNAYRARTFGDKPGYAAKFIHIGKRSSCCHGRLCMIIGNLRDMIYILLCDSLSSYMHIYALKILGAIFGLHFNESALIMYGIIVKYLYLIHQYPRTIRIIWIHDNSSFPLTSDDPLLWERVAYGYNLRGDPLLSYLSDFLKELFISDDWLVKYLGSMSQSFPHDIFV